MNSFTARRIIARFREETRINPSKLDLASYQNELRIVSPNGEEYPVTGTELFKVRSTRYNGDFFTAECEFPKGYLGTMYGPIELCYANIPNWEQILEEITVGYDIISNERIFEGDETKEVWLNDHGTWSKGITLSNYVVRYCDYHGRYEFYKPSRDFIHFVETDEFSGYACNEVINELDVVKCFECGTYHSREYIYEMRTDEYGDINLCNTCINDYGECEECGAVTRLDENCLCARCKEDANIYDCLNDYNLKPHHPKFKGLISDSVINGYIGFELEIEQVEGDKDEYGCLEDQYDPDETSYEICHDLNKLVYCKHDGSLDDTGIEIVSHPMTLEYLKSCESEFNSCFNGLINIGYRSHDTDDCGLHFHISRTALGDDDETVEARIIYVIEKFWNKLVTFSRRTDNQLRSWAKRNSEISIDSIKGEKDFDVVKSVSKYQKSGGHGERYHALNVTNRNTIEFRLFRGTLKFETLLASAQLCATIVKYCVEHNNAEMIECTWEDIAHSTNYEELNNYLEHKGL